MSTPKTGADERKGFYIKATHILFAIVLGHSFLLASDTMVPIHVAFEPANHTTTAALIFSYILIVSGWIGYARSVSFKPHKDTAWGAMRFILDLTILYEFFYLIRISQTDYVWQLPALVVIIFGTYLSSDVVKYYEHGPRDKKRIKHRGRITGYTLVFGTLAAVLHYANYGGLVPMSNNDTLILTIVIFTAISVLFRMFKWKLTTKRK